jgi:hypothetical protein
MVSRSFRIPASSASTRSPGDSHEQLEGLAGGLNLVVFFEVHPDSKEIDTYAPLAIPEVPRGTQKVREPNGDVITNTFWRQRNCSQGAGDGSSWVWLASSGFLPGGSLLAVEAEAPWSMSIPDSSMSSSSSPLSLTNSETWGRRQEMGMVRASTIEK